MPRPGSLIVVFFVSCHFRVPPCSFYSWLPIPVLLFPSSDSCSPSILRFQFQCSYCVRPPISGFQSLSSYFRVLAILAVLFLTSNSRRPSIPGFLFPTIAVVLFPASNSHRPISDFQIPIPVVLLFQTSYFRSTIAILLFPTSNSRPPSIPVSFNNAYVNNYFRGTTVRHILSVRNSSQ